MGMFVHSRGYRCGHIEICMLGGVPRHKTHITDTLQGHLDIGGRAGTCEKEEEGSVIS